MKAPGFWYPERKTFLTTFAAKALLPFSRCFRLGTHIRKKFAHAYHSHRRVVCIGNVVAGGAGKTPTALALAEILRDRGETPVFVTRGYGGNGVLARVDPARHTSAEVGDEALLLAARAPTWVCRDRIKALRQAEGQGSLILVDDGLQNPYLKPTTSILVIDGEVGIGNGYVMPAGPLREPLQDALKRVSAIVIVGAPDRKQAPRSRVPVFHAHLVPDLPPGFTKYGRYIAFAGIGRPRKFFNTARALGLDIIFEREFPDHHAYTQEDIDMLRLEAEEFGARLLTTEKDAVRLPPAFRQEVISLPVRLVFDDPGAEDSLTKIIQSAPLAARLRR